PGPLWQRIAALFVFMSVQWTIASAAGGAVIDRRRKFYRTPPTPSATDLSADELWKAAVPPGHRAAPTPRRVRSAVMPG
ncbi:MAG TPA: hypothetical protein VEK37_11345, partial [Gemmatimonadaceae bacterium]|nr:hypothetical protein [Gemmatimonadaceae bacterium]